MLTMQSDMSARREGPGVRCGMPAAADSAPCSRNWAEVFNLGDSVVYAKRRGRPPQRFVAVSSVDHNRSLQSQQDAMQS